MSGLALYCPQSNRFKKAILDYTMFVVVAKELVRVGKEDPRLPSPLRISAISIFFRILSNHLWIVGNVGRFVESGCQHFSIICAMSVGQEFGISGRTPLMTSSIIYNSEKNLFFSTGAALIVNASF